MSYKQGYSLLGSSALAYLLFRIFEKTEEQVIEFIQENSLVLDPVIPAILGISGIFVILNQKYDILNRFQKPSEFQLQEKKDHTQDILNVYKRLSQAEIRPDRHDFVIVVPKKYFEFSSLGAKISYMDTKLNTPWQTDYVSLEYLDQYKDYEYFDDAIKHLEHKTYKTIHEAWIETKKLLTEFNKKEKAHSKLLKAVDIKMQEFFPEFEKGLGEHFQSAYEPYVIVDVITNLWFVDRVRFDFLEIRDKYGKYTIISTHGTRPQLISTDENKLDLEKYKKLLKSLVTDTSLKQMYLDEGISFKKILDNLTTFEKELLTMIKNHKHKPLLGKCDSCPVIS